MRVHFWRRRGSLSMDMAAAAKVGESDPKTALGKRFPTREDLRM